MATKVKDVESLIEFENACKSNPIVVSHFWADWCDPCVHMDMVLQELASRFPNLAFLRVKAEEVEEVTLKFEVSTVPYIVILKDSKVVDRLEGANPAALTAKVRDLASSVAPPSTQPTAATGEDPVLTRIKSLLADNDVVLFMKGVPDAPRCGFSSKVVDALHTSGLSSFKTVDILQDEPLRQKLKEFSNWPTYPQLYVKSELVGGCDIILEMAASGELRQLLEDKLKAPTETSESSTLESRIRGILASNKVMLFMKGTPEAPRCGFSRKVTEAIKNLSVPFGSFDILTDEEVRQGLKEISNWPTYPQLYVNGELVGGCDIVMEMAETGELKAALTA